MVETVVTHVGMTPQSVHQFGGFRRQGTTPETAEHILQEAIALQQAGAFAIILEHIPDDLAHPITQKLPIPTIGIGTGAHCDGQVLLTADLLSLSSWQPPVAKSYMDLKSYVDLKGAIAQAVQTYSQEVRNHQFSPA